MLLSWLARTLELGLGLNSSIPRCKCMPGDLCWPNRDEWAAFNATVGGHLIATVSLASPCHDPHFDDGACEKLQQEWLLPPIHFQSSSSVMAPLFANQSCDPFTLRNMTCTLGNYVSYAVDVSGPRDIVATLQFARRRNIRFVIRNTGHDYSGRSTGAGALAVWTHHLKDTQILDWHDKHYSGKALKLGAGVQGFEALAAAKEAGLVVLTGECVSVGVAGGYTQGGGHSALSSVFGLAADNTLEFEVVTARGDLVTASRTKNADLYWAFSGGGGGVFGVVVSMTVRAHPDAMVSGAQLTVTADDPEKLFATVDAFHAALPAIVDAGVMVIYVFAADSFQVPALTAYNKTQDDVQRILEPFSTALRNLGVVLSVAYTEFDSYHDHYAHYWGPAPAGNIEVGTQLFGGRLIPRAVLPSFGPTARALAEMGVTFIGVGLNVSRYGGANAVLPQWRSSITHAALTLPYRFDVPIEKMRARQDRITREVQPLIEAATPGAGAYMNEADFQQRDFQDVFFGVNYPRLFAIKRRYDAEGLLYAVAGVGSEQWTVSHNGRMCRKVS
ncbi:FAD-binding domain-containing protein [Exidia glandulosa HHB12029]|uniref:FAD-binding domain-containing protein n=1 Tax=Exidia glandulosa HHB12029 TaxID=1314781 RepID=A0A165K4E4_EXIGL|nr:FAD-binding domain-containing protein [Exidia glandulosa HHB12029]